MSGEDENRSNRISAYVFNLKGAHGAGAYTQYTPPNTSQGNGGIEIEKGKWYQIVATFDPGDNLDRDAGVRIYVNGVYHSGPDMTGGAKYSNPAYDVYPENGKAPLRFGTWNKETFFNGALDEVAIFDKCLSADEVAHLYSAANWELT